MQMDHEQHSDYPSISPAEKKALRALSRQLHEAGAFRLATKADRQRSLRDLGLEPAQIAFISDILDKIRPKVPFEDQEIFDPPEFCPINWTPTVLTPVFWGRESHEVGVFDTPTTIYYPSLDGAPDGAPILRNCGRYTLILFMHGHCQSEGDHRYRWERHLAQLARSGFVVAAPLLATIGSGPTQDLLVDIATDVLIWMRTSWQHRDLLFPTPSTGVFGHSYGAMAATHLATHAEIGALASLSAGWHEWSSFGDGPEPLPDIDVPSLHMWGTEGLFSDEVTGARWDSIPISKHQVILHGGSHWEYLQGQSGGCSPASAECNHLGSVAGDLLACFFARYLPPSEFDTGGRIPISLRPPEVPLSVEQQFFAGGHLMGLKMLPFSEGCEITIGWEIGGGLESVTLGSP
jgi:pimeloyl-ACP methyl ester carboxylesterase